MKTKAIEFNADDLVGSVEAFARHVTGKQKLTLSTATMPLPPPVKPLTPSQVRSIRRKLNVSQPVFAAMMNIPTVTAASWERGRRKPTGAALRPARHRPQASRSIARRMIRPLPTRLSFFLRGHRRHFIGSTAILDRRDEIFPLPVGQERLGIADDSVPVVTRPAGAGFLRQLPSARKPDRKSKGAGSMVIEF
ncbi:MAG: hypothetical protein Q7S40_13305 [Opitutaceae bacterium]|nr:hypothetical protein [Opitutaceae bacterium]